MNTPLTLPLDDNLRCPMCAGIGFNYDRDIATFECRNCNYKVTLEVINDLVQQHGQNWSEISLKLWEGVTNGNAKDGD